MMPCVAINRHKPLIANPASSPHSKPQQCDTQFLSHRGCTNDKPTRLANCRQARLERAGLVQKSTLYHDRAALAATKIITERPGMTGITLLNHSSRSGLFRPHMMHDQHRFSFGCAEHDSLSIVHALHAGMIIGGQTEEALLDHAIKKQALACHPDLSICRKREKRGSRQLQTSCSTSWGCAVRDKLLHRMVADAEQQKRMRIRRDMRP